MISIALANDHAGYLFKQALKKQLTEQGYVIEDFGCDTAESCDYPDFAIPAVRSVSQQKNNRAILICGNGIGMSILANKIPGILAAVVYSETTAADTRKHHGSNVLCLGAREFEFNQLFKFVEIWLKTAYEGGRHENRIKKVKQIDK